MKIEARNAPEFIRHLKALKKLGLLTSEFDIQGFCKLRRIENKLRSFAVQYCNGEIDSPTIERMIGRYVDKYRFIPGFAINLDPRGYTMKIIPDRQIDGMHKDLGGFYIIAPEF